MPTWRKRLRVLTGEMRCGEPLESTHSRAHVGVVRILPFDGRGARTFAERMGLDARAGIFSGVAVRRRRSAHLLPRAQIIFFFPPPGAADLRPEQHDPP
jgi:hypothetical protein